VLSSEGITVTHDLRECFLFGHEFSLGDLQLCLGLAESCTSRSHLFGDYVILADGDHPLADPLCSLRGLANLLRNELWICKIALDGSNTFRWNAILIILFKTVEEFLIVI
jgi:hypothetical protein